MAPKSKQQFEILRQERKTAIIEMAMNIFAEKGMHGTSMNELAKAVGISKGLIYNYFSSKEELIVEMVSYGMQKMVEHYNFDNAVIDDAFMKKMVIITFDIIEESPKFWSVYFSVLFQTGIRELAIGQVMNHLEPFLKTMAAYFKSKNYEDPIAEALFIGSLLDGVTMNYLYNSDYYSREYATKRLFEILKITI